MDTEDIRKNALVQKLREKSDALAQVLPDFLSRVDSMKRVAASNFRQLVDDPKEGLWQMLSYLRENLDPEQVAMGFAGPGAIKAFHGSPYIFSKFSDKAIGSGQGAQAQGRGHYFAENPAVGDQYRTYAGAGTPGNLYEVSLRWPDAAREAADPLGPHHFLESYSAAKSAGAPGVRYQDAGENQYVVFDPLLIEILKRNGAMP